jgi:hypothetical protein
MAFHSAQGLHVDEHGDCGQTTSIPSIAREDIHAFLNRLYSLHSNQSISDQCFKRSATQIIRYLGQFQANDRPYPNYAFITSNGQRSGRVMLLHTYLNVHNQGGSELWHGNRPRTMLLHYGGVTDLYGKVNMYTHPQKVKGVSVHSLTDSLDGFSAVKDCLAELIYPGQHGINFVAPRLAPGIAQAVDYNALGAPLNSVNLNAAADVAGLGSVNGFAF